MEKTLKAFPLNILGTFLKISDQGVSERLEDVRAEVSQKRADRVIDIQQRIRDSIKAAGGKPTAQGAMQLFMDLRKENGLQPGTTLRRKSLHRTDCVSFKQRRGAALLDYYRSNLKLEEYRAVIVSPRSLLPLTFKTEQRKAVSR